MEQTKGKSFLICLLFVGLVAHNVVTPVTSRSLEEFTDQKNYYPPVARRSPKPPQTKPDCPPTPSSSSHPNPTPPSHGGSYGTPVGGHVGTTTPPASSSSHGAPTSGSSTPSTPAVTPPHSTPIVDPHLPPYFAGTCSYWGSHPDAIFAILGNWGDISAFFGPACVTIFGTGLSLPDALTNARPDGYGALFREGAAALLNSMANAQFPFTTRQVQDAFTSALGSDGNAAAQAALFRRANESGVKV